MNKQAACGHEELDKDEKYRKARDHCHCKIAYRGAAHTICILR